MALIIAIDIIIVTGLVGVTLTRGLERALPFFVFVAVFVPVEARIEIPGLFAVSGQRVAITTLVVLWLMFRRAGDGASPLTTTPLKVLLLLHIGWCALSTANSIVPVDSLKKMSFELVEYYLMYYILLKTITEVRTVHSIMRAMVLAVFVACVIGFFEAYAGGRVMDLLPQGAPSRFTGSGLDNRFYSTFSSPHLFGAAVACAIVEALYLLGLTKGWFERLYLWVAIPVMFLNVYKAVTRGPWLALALGIGLVFFLGGAATRRRVLAIVALTLLVLVARPGIRNTVLGAYQETADTEDANNVKAKSYQYRYVLWGVGTKALDRSVTRAIWGYGMESFYYLHLTGPFYNNPEYVFESCDSSWVELMVETGYVGLLIIAALLITPAILILHDIRKLPKAHRILLVVLLVNMLQYYFMMTNVALYGWGQTAYMLWMWIAMGMVYRPLVERERAQEDTPSAEPESVHFELAGAES